MKERVGMIGFMIGLIGCSFAAGAEPVTAQDWIVVAGVAATSLMSMQLGVWLINNKV